MDTTIITHPDCEMTLYTLTLIRLSVTLWERPGIKRRVKNYFLNGGKQSWNLKWWQKITKKVLRLADTFNDLLLPTTVSEIKDAVLNIGIKMYDWIWHMLSEHCLDVSHTEQIFWTPLGFVDEVKIFKHVWENDSSLYEGNKKIFLFACLYTQEEFVEEHLDEMIQELKKLPMNANINNVKLEVEDCSDEVYGVISTYLSYYIYENVIKRIGTMEVELFIALDDSVVLRDYLIGTESDGILAPSHIMVQLCAIFGLVYGVKYYYEKVTDLSQKKTASAWIKNYCRNKLDLSYDGKAKEILVYLNCSDRNWTDERLPSLLLYLCPLESFFWPYFKKQNNLVLSEFVIYFGRIIIHDYDSGLPANRNLFQKLLKEIWVRAKYIKIPRIKESIIECFIYLSVWIQDFTTLKKFLHRCEVDFADFQRYLRLAYEEVNDVCTETGVRIFALEYKFYKELFDSPADRQKFFTEQFCKSSLLMDGNFRSWENLYRVVNVVDVRVKVSIDPLKCLAAMAERALIERCDHFIISCHESKEDQEDLKNKFKTSYYLPSCIYKFWVGKIPNSLESPATMTYRLLKFFFESEDDINQYKGDKLSILGLLDASLCNAEVKESCYRRKNRFHREINEFINFCGITPEMVRQAKAVIREKIEKMMLCHLVCRNIETLDFLMSWVSLTEIEKKELFRKLYESSKIFNLCVDMLDHCEKTELDIFHDWLKLCGNICKLKSDLVLFCEGEKSEEFISEFLNV